MLARFTLDYSHELELGMLAGSMTFDLDLLESNIDDINMNLDQAIIVSFNSNSSGTGHIENKNVKLISK